MNARSILSLALLLLVGLMTMGASGCDKILAPQEEFWGSVHNPGPFMLTVANPVTGEAHRLAPGDDYEFYLRGSFQYDIKATLPDGTVYAEVNQRINSIPGDAGFDGLKMDWSWDIGHQFLP